MANDKTSRNLTNGASGIARANNPKIERGISGVSSANGGGQKPPPSAPSSSSSQPKKQE